MYANLLRGAVIQFINGFMKKMCQRSILAGYFCQLPQSGVSERSIFIYLLGLLIQGYFFGFDAVIVYQSPQGDKSQQCDNNRYISHRDEFDVFSLKFKVFKLESENQKLKTRYS